MKVLFGHQSVGADLLAWLSAARESHRAPAIVASRRPPAGLDDFVAHFNVGRNGDADSKIRDFVESVSALARGAVDVALFKFCYVDIVDESAAAALFERYTTALDGLQSQCSEITLAHVTVPLRTVRYGVRGALRRAFGQKHPEFVRNAARESFNARLRDRYAASGLLFDLADLESSKRSGSRVLLSQYTDDGGHLNQTGKEAIAPAFLHFLHELQRPSTASPTAHPAWH